MKTSNSGWTMYTREIERAYFTKYGSFPECRHERPPLYVRNIRDDKGHWLELKCGCGCKWKVIYFA